MIRCCVDDVLALTGGDPLVRGTGSGPHDPAWRSADGRTMAFSAIDGGGLVPTVVVLGEPEDAAGLLRAIRGEIPEGVWLSVPRGTPVRLDASFDWNFRAAYRPPPPQPAEGAVSWHADDEAITKLLRLAGPDSSVWPGQDKVRRWAAIRDGGLLACLADTTARPDVGHLSAIAVHPGARGRGLGPSITAWAMRKLFAEGCDVITLGVHAGNKVGIRVYDRLGFTVDRAFTCGKLLPRPPHRDGQ